MKYSEKYKVKNIKGFIVNINRKFIKQFVLFFTSIISTFNCITFASNETFSPDKNARLGVAYLNSSRMPMHNVCIKTDKINLGVVQKTVALSYVNNIHTLARNLNINLDAKAGWGRFSASSEVDYIKSVQESNRSLSFSYQGLVMASLNVDSSDYYKTSALNPGALAAYNEGFDSFILRCGDSYIQRLDLGAILSVTMRLNFASSLHKKTFQAKINGGFGDIFKASTKTKQIVEENNLKGSIDVIAFQKGGDPNRLDMIFGANSEHNIISCDIQNVDNCTSAINDIIDYAQSRGAWNNIGFSEQIKIVDNKLVANSLFPVNIEDATIGHYSQDFGLAVPEVVPNEDVIAARIRLTNLYDYYADNLNFYNSIKDSYAYSHLSFSAQQELSVLAEQLRSNMSYFTNGKALKCFLPAYLNDCPKIADNIEMLVNKDIDLKKLTALKGAYYFNFGARMLNNPQILVPQHNGNYSVYNADMDSLSDTKGSIQLQTTHDYRSIIPNGSFDKMEHNGVMTSYRIYPSPGFLSIGLDPNGFGYAGAFPMQYIENGTPRPGAANMVVLMPF